MSHSTEEKIGLSTVWAIGVGAAIGGDFFGWEFVISGGFYAALICMVFCAIFYWLFALAITELASRYKTSGGSFDFASNALGRKRGILMAVLVLAKLILANCATGMAVSSYLSDIGYPKKLQFICWVLTYLTFTFLDTIGVKTSATIQFLATILCVVVLLFYCISALLLFETENITSEGKFRDGASGFFSGLPFALQFFDGFEEMPLLMSYTIEPEKTMPRAITLTFTTVGLLGFLIVIGGGGCSTPSELLNSKAPLMLAIDKLYGTGSIFASIIGVVVVLGLFVNFFSFVIYASQQVNAIAVAGQFPAFLAYRHPVHNSPVTASLMSSLIGLCITTLFVILFGEEEAQDILVTSSLLPAVLGYALLMECIVNIRRMEMSTSLKDSKDSFDGRLGDDPGSLRFKYGIIGARIVQFMCALLFGSLLYLASNSLYFLHGLLILLLFGFLLLTMLLISSSKKTPLSISEILLHLNVYFRNSFTEGLRTNITDSDYELMDTSISNLVDRSKHLDSGNNGSINNNNNNNNSNNIYPIKFKDSFDENSSDNSQTYDENEIVL